MYSVFELYWILSKYSIYVHILIMVFNIYFYGNITYTQYFCLSTVNLITYLRVFIKHKKTQKTAAILLIL